MIRKLLLAIALGWLVKGSALAQPCTSYPYTLTNGTTADASQVMSNFNHVLNCTNSNQVVASLLRGWLAGLTMSNDATSPNTVIDTSAGVATSDNDTSPIMMTLGAFTKNANAAWAVGSGNGCLQSPATTLAASKWYHLYVITRTDTSVVDQFCVPEGTTVTLPSDYTKSRRIGSFRTNDSSQILAFSQRGDEFLWNVAKNDANNSSVKTDMRVQVALTVPPGIQVNALFIVEAGSATGTGGIYLTTPGDQPDNAPPSNISDLYTNAAGQWSSGRFNVRTDTSRQIGIRAVASITSYYINTVGWIDTRGK